MNRHMDNETETGPKMDIHIYIYKYLHIQYADINPKP